MSRCVSVCLLLCQRLIVYRYDRLAGDFEVSGKLLNILRQSGIELYVNVTISKSINPYFPISKWC